MAEINPNNTPTLFKTRSLSLNPMEREVRKQRDLCRVEGENGKYGGYWNDILTENITDREKALMICEICEGIMREAMISSSGEQFCSCCEVQNPTNKILRKVRKDSFRTNPNIAVRKMVSSLKCSCPLLERGCKWLGKIDDCEMHLVTCGHVRDTCNLGCGAVVIRCKLNAHANQSCPEREVSCEHCKEKFKFILMSTHLQSCRKMNVSCQLCHKVMCREYMSHHLEHDCPEKLITCPFAKYKCDVTSIKRKDLSQHLEEKEIKHLGLKISELELKLGSAEWRIAETERVARNQNERIKKLESKNFLNL